MTSELGSNMHATTKAFVEDAWSGKWSVEKAMALRAPECIHTLLPTSQAVPKRNNEEWAAYFKNVEGLIWDATMEMREYTVDVGQRKTACMSALSATTPGGPYSNEHVWFLTFNESGTQITAITDFIDGKKADNIRAAMGLQHR